MCFHAGDGEPVPEKQSVPSLEEDRDATSPILRKLAEHEAQPPHPSINRRPERTVSTDDIVVNLKKIKS